MTFESDLRNKFSVEEFWMYFKGQNITDIFCIQVNKVRGFHKAVMQALSIIINIHI